MRNLRNVLDVKVIEISLKKIFVLSICLVCLVELLIFGRTRLRSTHRELIKMTEKRTFFTEKHIVLEYDSICSKLHIHTKQNDIVIWFGLL